MKLPNIGLIFALAFTASAFACSDDHGGGHDGHGNVRGTEVTAPAGAPTDASELTPIEDKNPDPSVVEVDLEAREAKKSFGSDVETPVWTYNGMTPGPFIDAKVGDRLVVRFKNSLPEPTTIHWHGVRLPAAMDGTVAMQSPIAPGASFVYEFTLKDAGLFWFHPHVRSDIQVQKGLYGALRVRGAAEPASDVERVLVLDDIKLDKDGKVAEYLDDNSLMMGREGNTILVNGLANARVRVNAGGLVRLRLVNVANGRFFNLRVAGHKLRVIGTDGGLIPKPYDVDTLLMSPGERFDVMFVASGEASSEITLTGEPYERGHESGTRAVFEVARFRVEAAVNAAAATVPEGFRARLSSRWPIDSRSDETLVLNEREMPDGFEFTINDKTFPDVPPINVPLGETRAFEIRNDAEMDHPFHLHGFFFDVVQAGGKPVSRVMRKDTVIVPMKSSLKIITRFDEPGTWVYHCHILEHAEHGMMGELRVE